MVPHSKGKHKKQKGNLLQCCTILREKMSVNGVPLLSFFMFKFFLKII